MSDTQNSLDVAQLADRAGVTVRTVRYYLQQGLLPSAGARGPGARYDERHVARLQLIRRLQRAHLPLAEIRHRLEAMSDEDVERALALHEPPPSSAVEYARSILARTRSAPAAPAPSAPPATLAALSPPFLARHRMERSAADAQALRVESPPAAPASALPEILNAVTAEHSMRSHEGAQDDPDARADADRTALGSGEHRSTWERIPLAPDLELHVRRPLSREQNRFVARLLRFVHDIQNKEG